MLVGTTQTVILEAAAVEVETSTTQSLTALAPGVVALRTKSGAAKGQIVSSLGTPRLREYFPETLLWRPEILTDRAGHTTVKFPLADSITTWKVSVVASTLDGHIATASTDIRSFQPFLAELDPPKVLTDGDEIHLPVTVRNYLDKPQFVSLDWSPEPWAKTLSPLTAQLDVLAEDYAQKDFSFRPTLPAKDAKQRVTDFNRSSKNESDAIERKLRVHPDEQERLLQSSAIFSGSTTLVLDIPASSLPGSIEVELIISRISSPTSPTPSKASWSVRTAVLSRPFHPPIPACSGSNSRNPKSLRHLLSINAPSGTYNSPTPSFWATATLQAASPIGVKATRIFL